jgi:hypothetical protein
LDTELASNGLVPSSPSPGGFLPSVAGALTLRPEVFRAWSLDPGAMRRGLAFVLTIGLLVAVAGLVGAALTWWTSPDLGAMREAMVEGFSDMPWQRDLSPEMAEAMREAMDQNMEFAWRFAGMMTPSLPSALLGLLLTPLSLVLGWLVIGGLTHLAARLLGGSAGAAQTYGALALAMSPYLLGVVHVMPFVLTGGLGTWAMVCTYVGVKTVHGLSPGRAFWATVLPLVALVLVVVMVGVGVAAMVALGFAAMTGGGR